MLGRSAADKKKQKTKTGSKEKKEKKNIFAVTAGGKSAAHQSTLTCLVTG